jgi:hypothetical protein
MGTTSRAQIEYNANGRDFVSDLYDVTLTAKTGRGAKKAIGLKHIIRCVLCAAHMVPHASITAVVCCCCSVHTGLSSAAGSTRRTGSGLTPATSAPGLGSPPPHLHQERAHPCDICTGLDRAHPGHICTGIG